MKLSLIIPTYNEKDNIQKLLLELSEEFLKNNIENEIIVVDDNSPDGTGEKLKELQNKYKDLKIIHRSKKLGLSSAVLEGFVISSGDILGVMDADLSHPVAKINEMYQLMVGGADLVIGSRYVRGGKIEGWNLYRKILSKGATLLARVFIDVKDPMSGFFMTKKSVLINTEINSKGFKILLELLIKTNCKNIAEVPIVFVNRTAGKSKAGGREIVYFLKNLVGYLPFKRQIISEFFKFALVGLVGTLINIAILYTLTEYLNLYYIFSALCAFVVAVTTNFVFNKIWTFSEGIRERIMREYISFFLVSISALSINILFLYIFTEFLEIYYIVSQILAIGVALIINFIGNKIWTFHKK